MFTKKRSNGAGPWLLAACLFLQPLSAMGDSVDDDDDVDDAREHYEAREALRNGEAIPLDQIIQAVRKQIPGDLIEIEFDREDGRFIYELEIIEPSGRVIDVKVDAKTAEILEREEDD